MKASILLMSSNYRYSEVEILVKLLPDKIKKYQNSSETNKETGNFINHTQIEWKKLVNE